MCNPYLLHSTGVLLSAFQGRHITLISGILHLFNLIINNCCQKGSDDEKFREARRPRHHTNLLISFINAETKLDHPVDSLGVNGGLLIM